MKHLKLSTAIVFSATMLFSWACSNSSANKTTGSDVKASSPATKTASSTSDLTGRDGSFSYTIDGKRVETVNNVQNANLFINEVSNDAANKMANITVTCTGRDVFDFDIANSGTTFIDNRQPPSPTILGKKTKAASYMDGKTARNLYASSVTVIITSIDNSRITGTFSGTFKADESDGGATANIRDGSFNLPFVKN